MTDGGPDARLDPIIAEYGCRLVTYAELRMVTGYGPDLFRRAAAGHLTRYGSAARPRYELGEVLDYLRTPRPRATRADLTGQGPKLGRSGRVPFAA